MNLRLMNKFPNVCPASSFGEKFSNTILDLVLGLMSNITSLITYMTCLSSTQHELNASAN